MGQAIAGSVAFVTGANRGNGAALVEAFVARGAARVYASARDPRTLDAIVARHGGRVVAIPLDVTDAAQVAAAARTASDTTILVNNAGVSATPMFTPLTAPSTAHALRTEFEVNAVAPHAVTIAFADALLARGAGTVVNVASTASFTNFAPIPTYSASKAALHSLTQGWRTRLAPHGIEVLGVYPGPIDTDMARDFPMEKTTAIAAAHAILDGIEAGTEEILPDPVAVQLGTQYAADPKGLERAVAQMAVA